MPAPSCQTRANPLAPRARHQAVRAGSVVLVTGGSPPGAGGDGTFDPFSRATAERFDAVGGVWTAAEDMPAGRARHRAVPLPGGKVLIAGGTNGPRDDAGFASALVYDVTGDHWAVAGGLTVGRWAFAATALPGGSALVTGGIARSGLAAGAADALDLTATTEVFAP